MFVGSLALAVLASGCCCQGDDGKVPTCRYLQLNNDSCKTRGECAGDWMNGACYVGSAKDCRESEACDQRGRCDFVVDIAKSCVATKAEHCLKSDECKNDGACGLGNRGNCVHTDAGCRSSGLCRNEGRCVATLVRDDRGPGYVSGCAKREVSEKQWCELPCRKQGHCKRVGDHCVATEKSDCEASLYCTSIGRCSLDKENKTCVARGDDCAESDACENRGECDRTPDGDGCFKSQKPCARQCLTVGRCQYRGGWCEPRTTDDCRDSIACRVQGRCTPMNHFCVPADDEDCAESLECKAFGRCTKGPGYTGCTDDPDRAASRLHCIQSDECLTEDRCLEDDDFVCLTPAEVGLSSSGR